MPPRAVWKTRPSGVVPNLLMRVWSSRTRTGDGDRDGDDAGLVVGAMLQAAFLLTIPRTDGLLTSLGAGVGDRLVVAA
jgi:hypothetical protein